MKKIIFIELVHHHECIENPYLIYKKEGYQIKAILGEFVAKKLKNITEYRKEFFVLKQPKRKSFGSLSKIQKIKYVFGEFIEIYKNIKETKNIIKQENPNYLYINTIESPFLIPLMIYLLRIKGIKIHLTIHNTNRLKVGFLKYFLFDFLIKKLIKKSDRIILLGEYLRFEDKEIQKKVKYINNRIPKNIKIEKFKKKTFVISGTLNPKTKDIESILKGFRKSLDQNIGYEENIQLVLLGRVNSIVTGWIKKYNLTHIIKTFDTYIPEDTMERYLSKAHYAIISTYKDSVYGKYTISGAFGDAVSFDLPILLSESYAPHYKSNNITRFSNKEFDILLLKLI